MEEKKTLKLTDESGKEIEFGEENARKAKDLYQLLSSYNAYAILLMKAKCEYENKKLNIKQHYSDSDCYRNQIKDLFSLFKSDECLMVNQISSSGVRDILFLLDPDILLRMYSFDKMNSHIVGGSVIGYDFLKIDNCMAQLYEQSVYCGDPYYCDYHFEDKEAFGLFQNGKLVTPSYVLDSQLKLYNNMDIRNILKIQSLDEIYKKITDAKDEKMKKLVLTK